MKSERRDDNTMKMSFDRRRMADRYSTNIYSVNDIAPHTEFVAKIKVQLLLERKTGWLGFCSLAMQLCRKIYQLWMATRNCQ